MNDLSLGSAVYGELRQWHRVTIDFAGPDGAENRKTFYDTRLDVTFTNKDTGEQILVPGFFAADGDAANTGATSGDVWRVHFNPPSTGDWTYEATFRQGNDVAASPTPTGSVISGLGDLEGGFSVQETNKTGADFRAHGMIEYVGEHYLVHAGTGEPFIKAGPGSPENFFGYSGFDNTKGTHDYQPHVKDWQPGDPTWAGGEGKGIIGAVNYMASEGLNSMYMMLMNVAGDGRDVWPWADTSLGNINKNSSNISDNKVSAFDVSKLDQWEIVFDHMDKNGVNIHAFLQETENDQLLNNGELGVERAVYMREMIARFSHHNGLTWNLGEENTNTAGQLRDHAAFLEAVDPYDHFVSTHTFPGQKDKVFNPQIGNELFDGASIQDNTPRDDVLKWREESADSGHKWVVNWDETGPASRGIDPDSGAAFSGNNQDDRREEMWKALMAGAGGVEWYMGYQNPHNDLNLEDLRSRDDAWDWTAAASEFMETLPLLDMEPSDQLSPTNNAYVLAKPGDTYVVYLENGGSAKLDLNGVSGDFDVYWFDPRNGGSLKTSGVKSVEGGGVVNLGSPPNNGGKDWTVLVQSSDGAGAVVDPGDNGGAQDDPDQGDDNANAGGGQSGGSTGGSGEPVYGANSNGQFVLAAEDVPADGQWTRTTKYPGFEGDSAYVWEGPNRYGKIDNNPSGVLSFDIKVEDAGQYFLALSMGRTKDPYPGARGDEANDVYVRMDGGQWKKVFASGMEFEKASTKFGTTFDVNHQKSPAAYTLSEGVHTIEIAGRSTGAILDQIHLGKSKNEITKKGLEPSPLVDGAYQPPQDQGDQGQDDQNQGDQGGQDQGGQDQNGGQDQGQGGGGQAPGDGPFVTLHLADTKTDKMIASITAGQPIPAELVAGKDVTIYAEAAPGYAASIGSVVISYDGHSQTENIEPYALFGDKGGDFDGGTGLQPGGHTVTVKVYAGENGGGALLEQSTVSFQIAAPVDDGQDQGQDQGQDHDDGQGYDDPDMGDGQDQGGQDQGDQGQGDQGQDDGVIDGPGVTRAIPAGSDETDISGTTGDDTISIRTVTATGTTTTLGAGDDHAILYGAEEIPEGNYHQMLAALKADPDQTALDYFGAKHVVDVGQGGDDVVSLISEIDAQPKFLLKHTNNDTGRINGKGVAGENGAAYDHWAGIFGFVEIANFNPAEDTLQLEGHTTRLGESFSVGGDFYQTVYSEQNANNQSGPRAGAAHDDTFLGLVKFEGGAAEANAIKDAIDVEGMKNYVIRGLGVEVFEDDPTENQSSERITDEPILSFALADAATGAIVPGYENLQNGAEIDLSGLDLTSYTVIAEVNPDHIYADLVKRVEFTSNLGEQTERVVPYTLFGDSNGKYGGTAAETGVLTIEATAYGQGNKIIGTNSAEYTLIEGDAGAGAGDDGAAGQDDDGDTGGDGGVKPGAPSKILRFGLADTGSNQMLSQALTGQAIAASMLLGHAVTFYAEPLDGVAEPGSVRLTHDGYARTENVVPFALFGDWQGDYFGPKQSFEVGENVILFEVFEEDRAGGAVLETFEFVLTIENDLALSDSETNALLAAGESAGELADILADASDFIEQGGAPGSEDASGGDAADTVYQSPDAVNAGKLIQIDGLLIAQGGKHSGPATFDFAELDETADAAVNITVRAPMEDAGFNATGKFADYFVVEFAEDGGAFQQIDRLAFDATENAFISGESGARIGDAFSTLSYDVAEGVGEITVRLTPHVTGVKEFFVIADVSVSETPDDEAGAAAMAAADEPMEDSQDDLDQADALLAAVLEDSGTGALPAPSSTQKSANDDLLDAMDSDMNQDQDNQDMMA